MKILKSTPVNDLLKSFDQELLAILMEDIKSIRTAESKVAEIVDNGFNQDSVTAA